MHPTDAWLLVWAGPCDWPTRVRHALDRTHTAADQAHTILSREIEGDRWSLLLVHYTAAERDAVVAHLRPAWTYGFVNAVLDLDGS